MLTGRAPRVLALVLALFPLGCRRGPEPAPARRPNLVLLSIDTLRADHLGCYGYPLGTSPQIDALAARSTFYVNALAPAPWTLPSHAAMLTGVHPLHLGMLRADSILPAGAPLVAQSLQRAGYQTAAFVDSDPGGFLGRRRGFDRGFDSYVHAPGGDYRYDLHETIEAARAWMQDRDPQRPYFLFLHTKSVHTRPMPSNAKSAGRFAAAPYSKPARYLRRFLPAAELQFPWEDENGRGVLFLRGLNRRVEKGEDAATLLSAEQLRELVALYDAGIYYVDEQIKGLLEMLQAGDPQADTILILTADHGEAFLEHRFLLHREVYEPLLRVPLLVHDLRRPQGRRVNGTVHVEGVAATLLRLAGLSPRSARDGVPLPDSDAGLPAARPTFSFFAFGAGEPYEAYAVRDGRFKLIRHKLGKRTLPNELYDLARDPGERTPLADPPREKAMLAYLDQRLGQAGPSEHMSMGRQTMEELRALGYVQ